MRIVARYPGECWRCTTPFSAGTVVRWNSKTRLIRCRGKCPPAALAAARERFRASLTTLVLEYARDHSLTVHEWDTDPTRRGSLAWLIAPALCRIVVESEERANAV